MNPEGLPFFINPSVLADTSPIAHACAEEEVSYILMNSLCFLLLLRFYERLPVMLRETAGGENKNVTANVLFPPYLRQELKGYSY